MYFRMRCLPTYLALGMMDCARCCVGEEEGTEACSTSYHLERIWGRNWNKIICTLCIWFARAFPTFIHDFVDE
jgi:hypothetical protein